MPRFEVHGYGRDTGRKRKRVYVATDEKEAVYKAGDDGTIVETVTRRGTDFRQAAPMFDPMSLARGLLVKLIIIAVLASAISAGHQYRLLMRSQDGGASL